MHICRCSRAGSERNADNKETCTKGAAFTGLVLTATLLALTGCTHVQNRARDLADSFKANLGVGLGMHARLKVTDALPLGLGIHSAHRLGLDGPARPGIVWQERSRSVLLWWEYEAGMAKPGHAQPLWEHARASGEQWNIGDTPHGGPTLYHPWAEREYMHYEPGVGTFAAAPYWIEMELFVEIFGARLGFNPVEFADFLGGLLGLDLLNDDGRPRYVTYESSPGEEPDEQEQPREDEPDTMS